MIQGDLYIKNGIIVKPDANVCADILIKDGKVNALLMPGTPCQAKETIDAGGRYIIPGCVDGHVHTMDPGGTEKEDFMTGTMAAAVGGITTVIDHHRTVPAVYSRDILLQKIEHISPKACVDFGLKGGISPTNITELRAMWDAGITGFKTFTCDLHGEKAMSSEKLLASFREVARIDGTVLIHSEDNGIMAEMEKELKESDRTDYFSHFEWRAKAAERVAVKMVIELAKESGCRVIIAHVSQPELLELIYKARSQGFSIYSECCPHYFNLTTEDLKKKGPWVKFTPPMNTPEKIPEMWHMFNLGYVTTIGSDHCPSLKESKKPGEVNIWNAPNGIPGVETSLRLMLNNVIQGKTSLNRVVACMCENPAKMYGLYPRKGHLEPGADADFVILDMDKTEVLRNETVVSKCGWTPYDGMKVKGALAQVFVRGNLVAKEGKFVGTPGYGKFVRRDNPCI